MALMKPSQEQCVLCWYPLEESRDQKTKQNKARKKWSGNSALKKVNRHGNLFSLLKEKVDKVSDHDPNICK